MEFQTLAREASRVATGSLARYEVRTVFRRREAEGVLPRGEAEVLYGELHADIAAADILIQTETADMEREFGVVLEACFSQHRRPLSVLTMRCISPQRKSRGSRNLSRRT